MTKMLSNASSTLAHAGDYVVFGVAKLFQAEKRPVSYDMLFKDPKDGCARYDDVWGG